ncbi:MAG: endolytic transglycosylase MltG, partial [Bacteroidetes bacterium]|nr:endolytic transglycosylase MltG [Bacteroidota bacterium]
GYFAYDKYKAIYLPNVFLKAKKSDYLFIPTGSTLEDVANILSEEGFIINKVTFEWVAEQKNYKKHVYPGRYKINNLMSNNKLVDLLRSGEQEPLRITFNNLRTKEQLASRISNNLEADSASLMKLLSDKDFLGNKYGMNPTSILTMFIPNTYEFYWNISSEQFLERMALEYKAYWNDERKAKAKKIGLSQTEVSVLASIVQAEQSRHHDEKPIIAGLYINRIKKGMLLQSDPTLVYAHGDFTINRVLNVHKEIDSPYNTYKYSGLPPGPINLPEISSLNAVLDYQKHDFIFMCAKDDFSGYHYFAKNYDQHLTYARKYQAALNKRNIMK